MSLKDAYVLVVDDDACLREALSNLMRSAGLQVLTYASAAEFLEAGRPDTPACLLLDVCLPGLNGLELQRELAQRVDSTPIIFMTGHGDIPMSVRAMKAGAADFLTKPFSDQDLFAAIEDALQRDAAVIAARAESTDLRARLASLTPRERDVLACVVVGRLNKQTAHELGISEITVKVHRRHIMQKMRVRSVAELVRLIEKLG